MTKVCIHPGVSKSMIRLAHFVPTENGDLSNSTSLDIVLSALYVSNKWTSLEEVVEIVNQKLGCMMEPNYVSELIQKAENLRYIHFYRKKAALTPEIRSKMKIQYDYFRSLQETALKTWIEKLITPQYDELGQEILEELQIRLIEFLSSLCLSHGVASLSLIEGDMEEPELVSISELITQLTFHHEFSAKIAMAEYIKFLSSELSEIRTFLLYFIDRSFRYLTTICDPDILKGLKDELLGKIVYLDSSTVYRLLQLQGEHRYRVIKEVIKSCHDFGIQLRVSAMTLQELYRRIQYDSRIIFQYPAPTSLSAIGYKTYTEENFISTFWEQSAKTGISVQDFTAKYKHLDLLLEEEGIEVENNSPDFGDAFQNRVTELLGKINNRTDHEKTLSAAEHDAFLIALIERLRQGWNNNKFIDSPCWILSTDTFFLRFQKSDIEFRDKVPIAILPTQMLNLLRFTKPNMQFNETFLDVFSKAFIPKEVFLDNASIQMILARIAVYKGFTPNLAQAVLSDQLFTSRFLQSQSIAEKEDLIHEAIIEKARDLELVLEEKQQEVKSLQSTIEELTQRLAERDQSFEESYKSLKELEDQRALGDERVNIIVRQLEQIQKRNEWILQTAKKIGAILVFSILSAGLYVLYGKLPAEMKLARAFTLSSITLGIIPTVHIAFGNRRTKILSFWIGISATVLALYYSLM